MDKGQVEAACHFQVSAFKKDICSEWCLLCRTFVKTSAYVLTRQGVLNIFMDSQSNKGFA